MEEVYIEKLVHGGQGLGKLENGQRVFVWNALPGETVRVRILKKKRSYVEAIAEDILSPSAERIQPEEENYLATSPWQMMTFKAENKYKEKIVTELFAHEAINIREYKPVVHDGHEWQYRNKMEYSFWGDDSGLHLALYRRGTHGKQIVMGSKLALPAIDSAAQSVLTELRRIGVRASDLKTVIVRCNQKGEAAASLFVKPESFPMVNLPKGLKGIRVYHSNPRSPASIPTNLLYELGNVILQDTLLDKHFLYDVDSFFQVNIPVFEKALHVIRKYGAGIAVTDMYAGTGSIGLSVAEKTVELIELDPASAKMAGENARDSGLEATVIEASTEKVLTYINESKTIIFDPPRAGLHSKVVDKVLGVLPQKIIYLSCNPSTHARDLAHIQKKYTIEQFEIFNFFPRTPHIETLAVLQRK